MLVRQNLRPQLRLLGNATLFFCLYSVYYVLLLINCKKKLAIQRLQGLTCCWAPTVNSHVCGSCLGTHIKTIGFEIHL